MEKVMRISYLKISKARAILDEQVTRECSKKPLLHETGA